MRNPLDTEYDDNRDVPERPPFGGDTGPGDINDRSGATGPGDNSDPGDINNPGGTGETPRERASVGSPSSGGSSYPGMGGGSQSAPPTPRTPHPTQAASMLSSGSTGGVQPYPPMGSGPVGHPAMGGSRLFGSLGGLKGGGIGAPGAAGFNPQDPGQTPIAKLMAMLQKRNSSLF